MTESVVDPVLDKAPQAQKRCRMCAADRPMSEFYKNKRGYYASYCSSCCAERAKKYWGSRTPEQKKAAADRIRAFRQKHKARYRDIAKASYHRNRDTSIGLNYGMVPGQYNSLLRAQGGVCAICKRYETVKHASGTVKSLGVDHDHRCCPKRRSCGKCLRGLLCAACNSGLGYFKDDLANLRAAVDYLERWRR